MKQLLTAARLGFAALLGTVAVLSLSGCPGLINSKLFNARASETPAPNEETFDKSFFRNADGSPKSFLCAWAPEVERGVYGEQYISHLINMAQHCNIEFDITEEYLVGRMVNPSYPDHNNPAHRKLWKEVLKIPIVKHFYYEHGKDSHGRDTNDWVENSERSHWSARPKMRLALGGIDILDFLPGGGHKVTSVEDIEQDKVNNFLGFSINTSSSWLEGEFQGRFRINFLKFEHDKSFKKVPYNQANSRYFNILHILGSKIEGVEPNLYAAHWDLSKTTRLYISGSDNPQVTNILVHAVYAWNKTLQDIKAVPPGHMAFAPVVQNLKHPFDLRYPSVNWVSDRRISQYGPLGVGMAHADLENGKIIWGGVVLYGGMIERYINAYAPIGGGSDGGGSSSAAAMINPLKVLASSIRDFTPMASLQDILGTPSTQIYQDMVGDHQLSLKQQLMQATDEAQKQAIQTELETFQSRNPKIAEIAQAMQIEARNENKEVGLQLKMLQQRGAFGINAQQAESITAGTGNPQDADQISKIFAENDNSKRREQLHSMDSYNTSFLVEKELTLQNLNFGMMNGSQSRSYSEMLDSVTTYLVTHELGHFLGLGHQFKENILPPKGSVPSRYVKELTEKSGPAGGFSNLTSMMGYPDGRTVVSIKAENFVPGPQDELVLNYLYNGKYAALNRKADDWKFIDIPEDGKVPTFSQVSVEGKIVNMPTAYFPACNDWEASLAADPYCNRFDRGSSAEDIVQAYFDRLSDNLMGSQFSLVSGGGNASGNENFLWAQAFDVMSRVRLFYDEMRRRLRQDPYLKQSWDELRLDSDALLEFSQACDAKTVSIKSLALQKIFKDPVMVDLCRANNKAMTEFQYFVNLPQADHNLIDFKNRYLSSGHFAGDVSMDTSHAFGSWYQLSNVALKYAALYTMTTPNPYLVWGGRILRNPYYDYQEDRYLYRSLYAKEYTRTVSDAVLNNLRFAADGSDSTTVFGRTILAASYMLPGQANSNESQKISPVFDDRLDQQTQFNASLASVMIKAVVVDQDSATDGKSVEPDHYQKFTATIYDWYSKQEFAARDVYLLPDGKLIVRANNMFVYAVTPVKFYKVSPPGPGQEVLGYAIAYRVTYDYDPNDPLYNESIKNRLLRKHDMLTDICVNKLKNYFDLGNPDFKGYFIPQGMEYESQPYEKLKLHRKSITNSFCKFENRDQNEETCNSIKHPILDVCTEVNKGIGEISSAAALISGSWIGLAWKFLDDK